MLKFSVTSITESFKTVTASYNYGEVF